jgi:hypothetical protein
MLRARQPGGEPALVGGVRVRLAFSLSAAYGRKDPAGLGNGNHGLVWIVSNGNHLYLYLYLYYLYYLYYL